MPASAKALRKYALWPLSRDDRDEEESANLLSLGSSHPGVILGRYFLIKATPIPFLTAGTANTAQTLKPKYPFNNGVTSAVYT